MNKNKTLRFAAIFLQIGEILLLSLTILFVGVLVYSLFQPDAFLHLAVRDAHRPGFGIAHFKVASGGLENGYVLLKDFSQSMKGWLLLRGISQMGLTFFIIRILRRIVTSVQSNATFYEGNIQYFKRMSFYGAGIVLISSFNLLIQAEGTHLSLTIPFAPIAFTLGCLILAEIFQEGKILLEDKNSII